MNFQNCWPCFSLIELNFQFVFGVFDLRFELLALQNRTDRTDGARAGAGRHRAAGGHASARNFKNLFSISSGKI